jgi:hypothetical protein
MKKSHAKKGFAFPLLKGFAAAVTTLLMSTGVVYAALTFTSNGISSDQSLNLTGVASSTFDFGSGTLQMHTVNISSTTILSDLNSVRYASQYAGADWCAKVQAADSDLGSTAGEIVVTQAAGTSACASNISLSQNHILRFNQGGTYSLGSTSILLDNGDEVLGYGGGGAGAATDYVNIRFTSASGTAIESNNQSVQKHAIYLQGFGLQDTAASSSAIGLDITGIGSSHFADVDIANFGTQLYANDNSVGGYYNEFDHMTFSAGNASSGYTGVNLRGNANAQRFYATRFSRLTTQMLIGVIGDSGYPNEVDCFDCTFEVADTISVDIAQGQSISFYGGRWENDPIGVQVEANGVNKGILVDAPYIGSSVTIPFNDLAGALTVRDAGYGREYSISQGLTTSLGGNLAPNARFEGWSGTTSLLGWVGLSYSTWSGSSFQNQESTIECGNASQCLIHTGSFSAKIGNGGSDGRGIAWASPVAVDPRKPYTLTFWWTTNDIATPTRLGVLARLTNVSGTLITDTSSTIISSFANGNPPGAFSNQNWTYASVYNGFDSGSFTPTAANVLQRITFVMRFPQGTAQGDTAFVQMGLASRNGGGGYAYADDMYFGEGQASVRPVASPLYDSGDGGNVNLYSNLNVEGATTTVQNLTVSGICTGCGNTTSSSNSAQSQFVPYDYWGFGNITYATNTTKLYSIWVPYSLTFSHIDYYVGTADSVASDTYDFGLYNGSGTLVADVGATSTVTAGLRDIATVQGSQTISAGQYYVAYSVGSGNATTSGKIGSFPNLPTALCLGAGSAPQGTGALPATTTIGGTNWAACNIMNFGFHN